MMIKVCVPRIFGCAILAGLMLLGSTSGLAHSPGTTDDRDAKAAAAQLQRDPGQHVQLQGQIEIVHEDFKDGHGRFVYSLKQADGARVPMHFLKGAPTHLLTGDHVSADGQLSGGSLILYSGGTNVRKTGGGGTTTTSSIPVPYTFGSQNTLVILVNFQDDAVQPYTLADAQNAFFTAANNFIALGVLEALRERSLRVPEDVALVCFDDFPGLGAAAPFFTTVVQPAAEIGRVAIQLLLDRLANPELDLREVVLPAQLIVRTSCGCGLVASG